MTPTSQATLRRMMEQALVPPTQVAELDPTTIDAATSRLGSVEGNLAESYQLNSALTRSSLNRLPSRDEAETITDFYLATAGDGYDTLLEEGSRWVRPLDDQPWWVQRLLGPLSTHPAVVATLYNADLLLAVDDVLWRLVPNRKGLQFEGTWDPELNRAVHEAVPARADGEPSQGVLMIVGHITRASYLTGDRAYRTAAIASGTLIGLVWSLLSSQPPFVRLDATQQFIDHRVNEAARCDGVERGVQLLAFVDPLPNAAPDAASANGSVAPTDTAHEPSENPSPTAHHQE